MKLIKSFGYAMNGILTAVKEQLNVQIHLLAVAVVTIAGFYFHITTSEWCWVVLCFGMVLCAEMMNSAVESIVDLVSPGYHPLAGKAKDIAAGAVLVTAIAAAVIALLIFTKYILPV